MSHPNYYAMLTADVRYNKNLNPMAKLLFAEITALCNKQGFCWAGNEYFAVCYDVSERSIQRYLENLKQFGFIKIEIDQAAKHPRKIFLANLTTNLSDLTTNLSPAHDKSVTPSIYSINNTINTAGSAISFLLENHHIRFEQEFVMPYKKQFSDDKQWNAFLQDFNDEAEMTDRVFGEWLLAMIKKYARNWLAFRSVKGQRIKESENVNALSKLKVI